MVVLIMMAKGVVMKNRVNVNDVLTSDEQIAMVDIATELRAIINSDRVDPATRAEAQLGMFCVNMLGTALGVNFDLSNDFAN